MSLDTRHVRAVLIDLDGTLADTVGDIRCAVNTVLGAFARPPLAAHTVAAYVGSGVDVLLHRALGGGPDAHIGAAELERARALFLPAYAAVNGRHARLYPGVAAGLAALRAQGLGLACVTNKPERPAADLLARLGLADHFACLVGGDTLAQRKPDPQPLQHAAALLGVPLGACIMLGDSAIDAAAARAAGIPIVLVDYGYRGGAPIESLDADRVVPGIDALARLLARDPA
ncbi:phosphoglycolate phosphatase [Dokdonella sp.]|uniref:phosphoglycolate phosphatase n=1 Tax=Dokdonella sp. TaxID=2291710 RepID=UPI0031BD3291|nr:phosphoglycolate phosphatase [Dokdonella sp.]